MKKAKCPVCGVLVYKEGDIYYDKTLPKLPISSCKWEYHNCNRPKKEKIE